MDVFSPQKRSEVMARIRGRDTKPELALRSMLHRAGYRFTVRGPKNRSLPGWPDLVLPKYRAVDFARVYGICPRLLFSVFSDHCLGKTLANGIGR